MVNIKVSEMCLIICLCDRIGEAIWSKVTQVNKDQLSGSTRLSIVYEIQCNKHSYKFVCFKTMFILLNCQKILYDIVNFAEDTKISLSCIIIMFLDHTQWNWQR